MTRSSELGSMKNKIIIKRLEKDVSSKTTRRRARYHFEKDIEKMWSLVNELIFEIVAVRLRVTIAEKKSLMKNIVAQAVAIQLWSNDSTLG